MAWYEDLSATVSWRGLKIYYISRERTFGRRGTTDEFAGKNKPSGQDFGRKRKVFTFQGFVLGPDYMAAADAIEEACDADGAGIFRDLDGKSWKVICRSGKRIETIKEKGIARFSFQFEEAGDDDLTIREDTSANLLKAADALDVAALDMFTQNFQTDSFPDFVGGSAAETASRFGNAMRGLARSFPQLVDSENPYISSISGGVQAFSQYLNAGLKSDFGQQALGVIQTVSRGAYTKFGEGVPSLVASGLLSFAQQSFAINEGSLTPQRQQQQLNGFAFDVLSKSACLGESVRAVCVESFDSVDAGESRKNDVFDLIDEVQRDVGGDGSVRMFDDPVYTAATQVGLAMTRHIDRKTGGLPSIVRQAVPHAVPAVVAAFEKYGDASRVHDLEKRNSDWSAPLLPTHEDLEWLSS